MCHFGVVSAGSLNRSLIKKNYFILPLRPRVIHHTHDIYYANRSDLIGKYVFSSPT